MFCYFSCYRKRIPITALQTSLKPTGDDPTLYTGLYAVNAGRCSSHPTLGCRCL